MRTRLIFSLLTLVVSVWDPMPASAQTAHASEDGWWNLLNDSTPIPPPTTVPGNALGVGNNGAEPDKIAAMRIVIDAQPGSTVHELTLTLQQASGTGANFGSPEVVACPATSTWNASDNGPWISRPDHDCGLASSTGSELNDVWTFDLTEHAGLWLDPTAPLAQNGVVLIVPTSDGSSQVSFSDLSTGTPGLTFSSSPPATPTPVPTPTPQPQPQPQATPTPAPAQTPAPTVAPTAEPTILPTPQPQAQGEPLDTGALSNLPWGIWLLLPLTIALAGAISYSLGSAGRPTARTGRMGAVSRAMGMHDTQQRTPSRQTAREGAVSRAMRRGSERR